MNNQFIWNDENSSDYGVYVLAQPKLTIPLERSTQTNVPGRPGSLTMFEGEDVYDDIVLTVECYLEDPRRVPDIARWLKGSGTVVFGNRPGGHYKARVANQIAFEKILPVRPQCTFSVNFRCGPFWYEDGVGEIELTEAGTIVNHGSVYAEPIITVTGSGDITLTVNGGIVELAGVDGSITLNSELQEAYSGQTSLNDHMTGDFPRLVPGKNTISWTGTVTGVVVMPNWRHL